MLQYVKKCAEFNGDVRFARNLQKWWVIDDFQFWYFLYFCIFYILAHLWWALFLVLLIIIISIMVMDSLVSGHICEWTSLVSGHICECQWRSRVGGDLVSMACEWPNMRMTKYANGHICQKSLMPKCHNVKMPKFQNAKMSKCQHAKMPKCQNSKNVKMSKHNKYKHK